MIKTFKMIYFFIECLLFSFITGMSAAIYRGVLAYEPVLQWWFKFGNRFEKKWFFAPLWGCHKCIAGQLALWSYVFITAPDIIFSFQNIALFVFGLIFVICGAILTAISIYPVILKLENK